MKKIKKFSNIFNLNPKYLISINMKKWALHFKANAGSFQIIIGLPAAQDSSRNISNSDEKMYCMEFKQER